MVNSNSGSRWRLICPELSASEGIYMRGNTSKLEWGNTSKTIRGNMSRIMGEISIIMS